MMSTKSYDKILDDKNRRILELEEEVNKMRLERTQNVNAFNEETKNKLNEMRNNYENKIKDLSAKIDSYKEKSSKRKEKVSSTLLLE
jgi:DNA anti-recombination protein RmuC